MNYTGAESGTSKVYVHHDRYDEEAALKRIRTAGGLSISPELFEKLYLSPKNRVSNNLRSTWGNPTPLALVGFLMCNSPLTMALLGWGGATGSGAAEVGCYWFFGGLIMLICALLELFLGNTFIGTVFGTFSGIWFVQGSTLVPWFNASIAYQPEDPATSSTNPDFANTFAYFFVFLTILAIFYLVVSVRTNIVFFTVFLLLVPCFGCLSGFYFSIGTGTPNLTLQHTAGGLALGINILGWYLLFVQLLTTVDFPLSLPVGDLSHIIRGASERQKEA
ncbi:GPR1/FUN34/yaaH family-domain-containing protein [Aspergillus pseudoustus]|uniref:GPR1/FUN34/yaaH family-domain-containing protein n=1 Tax=Aspergillus pseudoustus TaxID=1810923 RepID=A0ABR4IMX4_9EURO